MTLNGRYAVQAEMRLWSSVQNLNEDRPILSAAKCSQIPLVSRNIRYIPIFAGVPLILCEGSNDCGVVDDGNFPFLRYGDLLAENCKFS